MTRNFWLLSNGALASGENIEPAQDRAEIDFDAVKANYPILGAVQTVVKLSKTGNSYKGCCPFHNEHTPSFHVIPDKHFAHCFGCGWNGDVIDFVAQTKGCDTIEAVRIITGGEAIEESASVKAARRRAMEDRERQRAYQKQSVINSARREWSRAEDAIPEHPYLSKKGVRSHGLKSTKDGRLLVPIHDSNGEIQALQTIDGHGVKDFPFMSTISGGRMNIGAHVGQTILCEGYATGASIHEAVSDQVCVTFSMGNMEIVARQLHASGTAIVLAADCGASAEKMSDLGEELGCPVAIPGMTGKGEDFNDQAQAQGNDSVARTIRQAIKEFGDRSNPPPPSIHDLPFDISGIDLSSPPGFAGELTRWIASQSRRPRPVLSVAAALTALGNIGGLQYRDTYGDINTNLFAFCVAGSATGKESAQQSVAAIHRAAGLAAATHGAIKSEQEITRNLIRHQSAYYIIDEIAHFLRKVKNAQSNGGAAYLDGVIGYLMSVYSKSNGFLLLSGDKKDDVKSILIKEMASHEKRLEEGDSPFSASRLESIRKQLETIDDGLERPFLSMIGFTTPIGFDDMVDFESATNGFIGRSLMFVENDTAPRSKKGFVKEPMSDAMKFRISSIANAGACDVNASGRIEWSGERISIDTYPDAISMLLDAVDWFEDQAIAHKGGSGLEALYLRAYEIMAKVSFILALPEGVRTAEHVRWAFALVRNDIEYKIRLVTSNDRVKDNPMLALQSKIANICSGDGETTGVIYNRIRGRKREDIDKAISVMENLGQIAREDVKHPVHGKVSRRYRFVG